MTHRPTKSVLRPFRSTPAVAALSLALSLLVPGPVAAGEKETDRLKESREVLIELAGMKEGAPQDILEKAKCVIVIPGVKKAALGVGGRFGYGAAVCRTDNGAGPWGPPLMVSLKGGSVGFQIGGQESDFVLLVMNQKGVDNLLKSKFTLGADASIAAGPIGRNAEAATDLRMRAEILSYSRSRGVFAGISLEGASLRQDTKANREIYGRRVDPRTLLLKAGTPIPAAGRDLVEAIDRLTSGQVIAH
jgi:lipid-binding SYLF domain-containing protein